MTHVQLIAIDVSGFNSGPENRFDSLDLGCTRKNFVFMNIRVSLCDYVGIQIVINYDKCLTACAPQKTYAVGMSAHVINRTSSIRPSFLVNTLVEFNI